MSTRSQHHPPARALARSSGLVAAVALAVNPAAGEEPPWRYVIGQPRLGQQATFCLTEADTLEIASIFETYTPMVGYAALANAPGCSTRVESFTPQRVIRRITIAPGQPSEYQLTFIEVVTATGDSHYLVTTRDIEQ